MKQILQSLKDGTTQLTDAPAPSVVSGQLLIHATASLVSAGTERMLVEFGEVKGLALSNEPARCNGVKPLVPANALSPG
jgi:hypothetical protein